MKGKYALQILEAMGEIAINAIDILQVVIEHPSRKALLTESYKNLAVVKSKREKNKAEREEYFRRVSRYKNLIAWLKRDGMIKEIHTKKEKRIYVTAKGKKYREMLLKRRDNELPNPRRYKTGKKERIIIVSFDIPEKEKYKRAWLRQALKEIGFRMIQKSVWFGRAEIPFEMLRDLHHLHLLEFIEIFSVTQKGSLRKIKHPHA